MSTIKLRELALFSGIGGGILGSILLGHHIVGAVDNDEYCCKVLLQRQKDGILSRFPIWNMDIRTFNERIAGSYAGMVELITAGFPCQPFSGAGKNLGEADERNMWPATIECIRIIRPRFALLENVPGLLVHRYIRRIYGDLAESGYNARWRCLSAAEVGANHKRKRWWVVAYNTDGWLWNERSKQTIQRQKQVTESSRVCNDVADTTDSGTQGMCKRENQTPEDATDTKDQRPRKSGDTRSRRTRLEDGNWWTVEPDVGRLAYGIPNRVDRLKAIGNAQVPAVVKTVWRLLSNDS